MTPIRELERGDLAEAAALYELVVRSGSPKPAGAVVDYFERTLLDQPWADPEIPSLVYDQPGHGIVGFIASHPRRMVYDGKPIRLGCSGQLVAHPDFRARGVGALLMRRYLSGPQDITITDGATATVRQMWERLGGHVNTAASIGWTRILGPSGFAAHELGRRSRHDLAPAAGIARGLDRVLDRGLRLPPSGTSSVELTPVAAAAFLDELQRAFPILPAYDEQFLDWVFGELERLRERGRLVRRLVADAEGSTLGWYIAYLNAGGTAQTIQIAATPENAGAVIDDLLAFAHRERAVAVEGRIEPHIYPALTERRCLMRRTDWALLHSADPELLAKTLVGDALLTRLEGEWWMGPHLLADES